MPAARSRPVHLALVLVLAAAVLAAVVLIAHRDGPLAPAPASAQGATIVVTTLQDPSFPMSCSLRQAIQNANANSTQIGSQCAGGSAEGVDTIVFDGSLSGTIILTGALPAITDPAGLTIDGDGRITVSGNEQHRPFLVETDISLTLSELIVEKGSPPPIVFLPGNGGAIFNRGTLQLSGSLITESGAGLGGGIYNAAGGKVTVGVSSTVQNSLAIFDGGGIVNAEGGEVAVGSSDVVLGNEAVRNGGGIFNSGTLTLSGSDSLVRQNTAGEGGGGIYNKEQGVVTITGGAAIEDNTAADNGGGIYNDGGEVTVSAASTISGNNADNGGGVHNSGDLTVTNSTISNNIAFFSGGIDNAGGTVALTDSIISGNKATVFGGIRNSSPGDVTITRSEVNGNRSSLHAGGIINTGTLTLTHSTVSGNVADLDGGGGIWNSSAGELTITHSTVRGNEADGSGNGGGIWNGSTGMLTLTNATVTANHAAGQGRRHVQR